jgi:CMP-N,N'-diacetyllegionaminic acid synthase
MSAGTIQGQVLAVIPARGGSKSIPRKNLAPLCGRPLIVYTFQAAKESRFLDRVLLSTDDEEIADVGRRHGIEVPFLRPAELARDDTPTLPVIQHAVEFLEEAEGYRSGYVVILQPTSPLRRGCHIDDALQLLAQSGADSVVSVVEVPHNFNPVSVMRIVEGRLKPFLDTGHPILRRQDKPRVYARNGPAVLAMTYETLMLKGDLFGEDCRPYIMPEEVSVDIDKPFDLELASLLLDRP